MKNIKYDYLGAGIFVLLLLVIDQIIKVWVKTHMLLGESRRVFDWFYISFIENNGMAYGMTFINKWVLSSFRIVAVCAIGYYIYKVIRKQIRWTYVATLCMILAGAAGNIIDCLLYGQIFTVSTPYNIAEHVSFGSGYAPMLQGRVVDMFYFPLIVTNYPDWFPVWGGQEFIFFSPVFNFADACISVGVALMILFFRRELETIQKVWSE